jgi:hypothetical protein
MTTEQAIEILQGWIDLEYDMTMRTKMMNDLMTLKQSRRFYA